MATAKTGVDTIEAGPLVVSIDVEHLEGILAWKASEAVEPVGGALITRTVQQLLKKTLLWAHHQGAVAGESGGWEAQDVAQMQRQRGSLGKSRWRGATFGVGSWSTIFLCREVQQRLHAGSTLETARYTRTAAGGPANLVGLQNILSACSPL